MRTSRLIFLACMGFVLMVVSLAGVPASAEGASKPMVLSYALHTPPPVKGQTIADQAAFEYWTGEIEAATEGRVKFRKHYASVLGKVTDFLKMVSGVGVADVGNMISLYNQWTLPLCAGTMQPFITKDIDVQGRAFAKLYNEWAPMREEWVKNNLKPLWWYVIDPYMLVIKEKITKLDDLRGKKIWGAGGFAEIIKKFDINQVFFPAAQAYEALQKGTLDGVIFPYTPINNFKFNEVCKVFVDMSFAGGQAICVQAINLDVWDKISPGDQKKIETISAEMHDWYMDYYKKARIRMDDFYRNQGVTFISFSPEEQARIKSRCAETLWADWIAKCQERNVPAEEFMKRYKAIVKGLTE